MTTTLLQIYQWCKTIIMHLWFSISSVQFYQRVMSSYKGYGVKYIFTLSIISGVFCSVFVLNYTNNIKQYFSTGAISQNVVNLDHIFSQLPELNYNGSEITLEDKEPVLINNIDNKLFLLIDPDNKIESSKRRKVPVLFANKKIIINFADSEKSNISNFQLDYSDVFGKNARFLTQDTIKLSFGELFSKTDKVVIYIMLPIITFFICLDVILEKSFFIVMIYLITNFFASMQTSIKTCARLVLFASGVFCLVNPIILIAYPGYGKFVWIIQIWANFLMVIGIIKSSNKKFL